MRWGCKVSNLPQIQQGWIRSMQRYIERRGTRAKERMEREWSGLHPERQMKSRRECHSERMQLKHSAKHEMCINERANKDDSGGNAITVLTTKVETTI